MDCHLILLAQIPAFSFPIDFQLHKPYRPVTIMPINFKRLNYTRATRNVILFINNTRCTLNSRLCERARTMFAEINLHIQ